MKKKQGKKRRDQRDFAGLAAVSTRSSKKKKRLPSATINQIRLNQYQIKERQIVIATNPKHCNTPIVPIPTSFHTSKQ